MTKGPLKTTPVDSRACTRLFWDINFSNLIPSSNILLMHKKRGFFLHAPAPPRPGNTFNCRQALSEPGQTQQTRLNWEVPQVPHALDAHADQGGTFVMLLEKTPIPFWRRAFRSFEWWASSPVLLQASPEKCRSYWLSFPYPSLSLSPLLGIPVPVGHPRHFTHFQDR